MVACKVVLDKQIIIFVNNMAEQSGDTCDLDVTLYHWTHCVQYERDDDVNNITIHKRHFNSA